jgi:hypothetical protein
MTTTIAFARRAILKKDGFPDIRIELTQSSRFGFTLTEDGKAYAYWPKYSPEQLKTGDCAPRSLDQVWQNCIQRFPGYTISDVEEAS